MKAREAKMIPLTRVGKRYQVTIPKEARQAIGLKVGDFVEARPGKECIVLYPETTRNLVDVKKRLAKAEADVKASEEMLSSLRRGKPAN